MIKLISKIDSRINKRISSHGVSMEYQMELFTFKQVLTITLWLLQIYKISWFLGLILADSMIWEEGCHLVFELQ